MTWGVRQKIGFRYFWLRVAVAGLFALALLPGPATSQVREQRAFASAEEAAQALADACAVNDVGSLHAILGPVVRDMLSSGDVFAETRTRKRFAAAFEDLNKLVPEGENRRILHVGREEWPFPIPIVKRDGGWQFETIEGADALLQRRIEGNEAAAIRVCRLYVELQQEYASRFRDPNNMAGVYAKKFMSDPGKRNGLYWKAEGGGERSPAAALVELAEQEGFGEPGRQPRPFHGYFFRILTAQGENAPGGKRTYFATDDIGVMAERKMTQGFAGVAFPAKYRSSGVMTFIVNQDGVVYQKDLGEATAELGRTMQEYNPDDSWAYAP